MAFEAWMAQRADLQRLSITSVHPTTGASDEDLAQTMGHASPQVTKSIYLHALPDSARRVTALVNDLLPPDPKDQDEDQVLVSTLLSLRVRRDSYDVRTSTE